MELLDALGSTRARKSAAVLATHLPVARRAREEPDLTSGARAITGILDATGPHAPIEAIGALRRRGPNPILGALQLHHHKDRLTPGAQLTFRCGAELCFGELGKKIG